MPRLQIDANGDLRCPRCGSNQFERRRSKLGCLMGGLLFAPRRTRCVACGAAFKRGKPKRAKAKVQPAAVVPSRLAPVVPPVPPVRAAGWYTDPHGGDGLRYWDGAMWTGHVAAPLPPPPHP